MEENTFLNADNIYEEVEGEAGKTLSLEEDQQRNLIGIIKGVYGMKRFHYIISLYFWFTAFIIHYETVLGRYTDIMVNLLLCPPQYLLKNNILAL